MTEPLPHFHLNVGTFLIASPEVEPGPFFRAVLLLCEHGPEGSFGVVINKPLDVPFPEEVLNLASAPNPHIYIRTGGPAHSQQMIILSSQSSEKSRKICDDVYLGGDITFLQESMKDPSGPTVFLCLGFKVWGVGDLEKEYLAGKWFLMPATSSLVFDTRPEQLWPHLLRDMGGKYASLSTMPEDLSLN